MTHTHADGCPCKKHKAKRRAVRSKVVHHLPNVGRPMPSVAQMPTFSFALPPLPAPHFHLTTNQTLREVESVAPGKVGVIGNKVQETSHIETKAPETQHSVAVPQPKFEVHRKLVESSVGTEPLTFGKKNLPLAEVQERMAEGEYLTRGSRGSGKKQKEITQLEQEREAREAAFASQTAQFAKLMKGKARSASPPRSPSLSMAATSDPLAGAGASDQ